MFHTRFHWWWKAKAHQKAQLKRVKQQLQKKFCWRGRHPDERKSLVEAYLKLKDHHDDGVLALAMLGNMPRCHRRRGAMKSILYTWHGLWGVLDPPCMDEPAAVQFASCQPDRRVPTAPSSAAREPDAPASRKAADAMARQPPPQFIIGPVSDLAGISCLPAPIATLLQRGVHITAARFHFERGQIAAQQLWATSWLPSLDCRSCSAISLSTLRHGASDVAPTPG